MLQRIVTGVLILASCGSALAALSQEEINALDKSVTLRLAQQQIKAEASTCFSESQMLVVGYQSKQKGMSVEQIAEMVGVNPGDAYYEIIEMGTALDGPLDRRIADHFRQCIDRIDVTD